MTRDKVLITGSSGLLGSNLAFMLSESFAVHIVVHNNPIKLRNSQVHTADITNSANILGLVERVNPAYIIHTAALTNVDYCELHQPEAWKTNVEGTRNVVEATKRINSKLVYISTDSVFDGRKGMYKEEDARNPLNFYTLTKAEGEKIVAQSSSSFVILRTNIYGWNMQNKQSLAEWILWSLTRRERTTLFSDIFFTPILVNNISDVISEILLKGLSGVFHVAGSERCNKLQFGLALADVFGLNKDLIDPIPISEKKLAAQRPLDSSLCTAKIRAITKTKLLNIKEGLEAFKGLSTADMWSV